MIEIINNTVLSDGEDIGHISKWCCGTDFLSKTGHIFSIRVSKTDIPKLIDCITEIVSLPLSLIPKKHYNWHHRDFIFPNGKKRPDFENIKKELLNDKHN